MKKRRVVAVLVALFLGTIGMDRLPVVPSLQVAKALEVTGAKVLPNEKRFGGTDRYETSIKVSVEHWELSEDVILASGEDFPDALCASPLSKKKDAPILLTGQKEIKEDVLKEIKRLGTKQVYIIGGTGAVGSSVETILRSQGLTVTRIAGKDRYETSIAVAKEIGSAEGVVVASGENFPDALSVAPIAAVKQMPILLSGKNVLPSSVGTFIRENKITKGYIVGGEVAISSEIEKGLKGYKRLSGQDRFATNTAIMNEFMELLNFDNLFIATSGDYPDALSGSASAAKLKAPIFLSNGRTLFGGATLVSKLPTVKNVKILGGVGALSNMAVERLVSNTMNPIFQLGDDQITTTYKNLVKDKKLGIVTNQTGVNSSGVSVIDILRAYGGTEVMALYGPEHGIDGQTPAGEYVKSYIHSGYNIPVYSLYGDTRMPTAEMLQNIDALVFDIQDIGARSYTYMSTLNYCMVAAAANHKEIIVLDRPNPLGGITIDGPILEDKFKTFVGVDNLPMTHGMTPGELAQFFNRKIGAKLTVVPMKGYEREMIFSDTGLNWIPSSPCIPDLASVFGYNATGLAEGTNLYQADSFKWVGSKGLNSFIFAARLNSANLPGVVFIPENKGNAGGVHLEITNYHTFNAAKTGIYVMAYAHSLTHFVVPQSNSDICMFDKIMGTDKIGFYLEQGYTAQEIEGTYKEDLQKFKRERNAYLLY